MNRDFFEGIRTCFQDRADYDPAYTPKADMALVYGVDADMPRRLAAYRNAGYRCAVMLGIVWGDYGDYYAGGKHDDEIQTARSGKKLYHGPNVPYTVPTREFCDYITGRLKPAVDAGAEGVVIEEPELYGEAGYSEAFKREWESEYGERFMPQHASVEAMERSSRLKKKLLIRAVQSVARGIKAYAKAQNKAFFVTVAVHSPINYAQWGIVSPVSEYAALPETDALIAQVWTGTSRTAQALKCKVGERVFENAYLEYAALMAAAGDKPVFLLSDPIEDSPAHGWEMYERGYRDTLTASLLQPGAMRFEICPWPKRVFTGRYPRFRPGIDIKGDDISNDVSKPIPEDYAGTLAGAFEMLRSMPEEAGEFQTEGAAMFISDTWIDCRPLPDNIPCDREYEGRLFRHLTDLRSEVPGAAQKCDELLVHAADTPAKLSAFRESTMFPEFFALALPLVVRGVPLEFVYTSSVARQGRLPAGIKTALLSWDFMKSESPRVNEAIADWVKNGGRLTLVSDLADDGYLKAMGRDKARDELLGLLNVPTKEGIYDVGSGSITVKSRCLAKMCLNREDEDLLPEIGSKGGYILRRGGYVIAAATQQTIGLSGSYTDMLSPGRAMLQNPVLRPGERAILRELAPSGD